MCPAKQIIQSESFLHNWLYEIFVCGDGVIWTVKNAERKMYYLEELFQQIKE